jgi:hypothetical protein
MLDQEAACVLYPRWRLLGLGPAYALIAIFCALSMLLTPHFWPLPP